MSMPVGIGSAQADLGGRGIAPIRAATPRGFNPLALWIAAASPVAATLLLLARLAA
jgi:hypothetical protein